jgi:hypothetical protein
MFCASLVVPASVSFLQSHHSSLNNTLPKFTKKKLLGKNHLVSDVCWSQENNTTLGSSIELLKLASWCSGWCMDSESLIPSAAPLHRPGLKIWTVMVSVTPLPFVGISMCFSDSSTLCENATAGQVNSMV